MSTQAELQSKLNSEYIKIDPNHKIWDINTKNSFLNGAFLQIQKDWWYRRPENYTSTTQATVAWTAEYSLPSDFIKIDMVSYSGVKLNKTYKKNVRLSNPDATQGKPNSYYLYGSNIGFDPVPDSSYNIIIDYFKKLPTITSSQDCELPSEFDNAICAYAAYIAFNSVEKTEKAQIMFTQYQQELNLLLSTYLYTDLEIGFPTLRYGNKQIREDWSFL